MPPLFDSLVVFFLYVLLDALALPIASTVYVAYLGQKHPPLLVAGLGAIATTVGSIGQYVAVRWLLAHPRLQVAWLARLRANVESLVGGAGTATFWALFVVYATPLGAGPLRLVAAAGGYPLTRFAAAILLGCLPYYSAVAWLGSAISLPGWLYALVIGLAVVVSATLWMARDRRLRREDAR